MASEKLTRKEIKNPDPFVRVTSAFWAKIIEQRRAVAIGLVAALAVFVVAMLLARSAQTKSRDAGGALARALDLAHRPVEGTLEALQDPAETEKFKTFKEKNEALAKVLDEVRQAHPGTAAASTATLFWGDAEFHLGKLDEAAKAYEQYLAETQEGADPLRLFALEGLGYVHESKKELDKALDAFDRMSREAAGDPAKARAAYHRARVLETQGKKPEAAVAFQKCKDEFKEAPAARDSEERLALLALQGVPMPQKAKPPAEKPEDKPEPKK